MGSGSRWENWSLGGGVGRSFSKGTQPRYLVGPLSSGILPTWLTWPESAGPQGGSDPSLSPPTIPVQENWQASGSR